MSSVTRAMWLRTRTRVSALASVAPVAPVVRLLVAACVAIVFTTCTMSDAPTSPRSSAGPSRLSLRPQFTVFGGAYQSEPINRIHLVARTQPALTIVADTVLNVQPTDASWSVGVDIRLPDGQESANVVVTIELINVTAGVSTVEWSGVTEPIAVTAGGVASSPPPVPVFPGPPANLTITSVTASPESVSLIEGDSASFDASVDGAAGTPLVIWSTLDPAIAAVSASGMVRGLRNGTARIVAQAGPKADTVFAHFAQRAVSLNVQQDSVVLNSFGHEATLVARVADPRGDSIPGALVTYSLGDGGVAEITGLGRVRARANGRTYLYATSGVSPVLRDSALVVVAQRISTAAVTPPTATLNAIGLTAQFSASATDANNNVIAATAAWSSDNTGVATVDGNGLARSVANGTARITATFAGGVTAVATLTVTQQPTSLTLSTSSVAFIALADTSRIRAIVRDANGNEMVSAAVTWSSSDPAIAAVDGTGLVRAVGAGSAVVTARAGLLSATAAVTVAQRVAVLTVSPHSATLSSIGATVAPTVTATDARGGVVARAVVSWSSSNPAAASVSADGGISATGNGSAVITATADGARDSVLITVRQVAVRIAFAASPDSLAVGDSIRLQPTAFDAMNTPIADAQFIWRSSSPAVASVNNSGVVRALTTGAADITAESDGQSVVRHLRTLALGTPNLVMAPFTFAPNDTLREGTPRPVGIKVRNSGSAASSATMVHLRLKASVSGPVLVTDSVGIPMILPGDSIVVIRTVALDTVTQYPDSVFAQVQVDGGNVVAESVETDNTYGRTLYIQLNVASVHIRNAANTTEVDSLSFDAFGDTVQLAYRAFDRFNRPITGRPIFWAVSNPPAAPPVAFVNALGRAFAVGNGTAQITLQIGTRKDTATVRVTQAPVSMTVFPDSLHMQPGDSAGVNVQGLDRTNVAVQQMPAILTSSNTAVATVDGLLRRIHAVAAGTAVVHVNSGALHDSVVVHVGLPGPPHSWTGAVSTDWNNAANWAPAVVPSIQDTVQIPVAPRTATLSGQVTIGALVIAPGAAVSLNNFALTVTSNATIGGTLSGGTLRMSGTNANLHVTGGALPNLEITGAGVFVPLPLSITGALTINGGNLVVGNTAIAAQSLVVSGSGRLTMNGAAGVVDIQGAAIFDGAQTVGALTDGTLRVGGDFVVGYGSYEAFAASSNHITVLNGSVPQNVSFGYPETSGDRQHFGNLQITNAAGVTFNSDAVSLGTVTIAAGAGVISGPGHLMRIGGSLLDPGATGSWHVSNTTMLGSLPTVPANLSTNLTFRGVATLQNNYALDGTLAVDGGGAVLDLNAKTVTATGGVRAISGGELRIGTGSIQAQGGLDVIGSSSRVTMDNPAGVLSVRGDAVFDASNTVGTLTAGTLRVGGNFTVGFGSYEAFAASGVHLTVLDGSASQSVSFAYPELSADRQHFGALQITNPAGVVFSSDAVVLGTASIAGGTGAITGAGRTVRIGGSLLDPSATASWRVANTIMLGSLPVVPANLATNLTFRGNATLQNNYNLDGTLAVEGSGAILDVNAKTVTATGGVRAISGGELRIGSGSIVAAGGLDVVGGSSRLRMDDAAGLLAVGGNAVFDAAQTVGSLTAGTLRVGGNFTVGLSSYEAFAASGTHITELNGSAQQVVGFGYPELSADRQHFQNLSIANTAGVTFTSDAVALGDISIASGTAPVTGAGRTIRIGGSLLDPTNTGSWQAGNTIMLGNTPVVPQNLATNLTFRGTATLQNNYALVGTLAVEGAGATLDLNAKTVSVTGNVRAISGGLLNIGSGSVTAVGALEVVGGSAALQMQDAAGNLSVGSGASFDGAQTVGRLTAGTLRVGGNFTVGASSYEAFAATGAHVTILNGAQAQTVSFAYPDVTADRQHFANLRIENAAAAGVTFTSNAIVLGTAELAAGTVLVGGAGATVNIGASLLDAASTGAWHVGNTIMLGAAPVLPANMATSLTFRGTATLQNNINVDGGIAVEGSGASLNVNGKTMAATGTLRAISGGTLNVGSGNVTSTTLAVTGSSSALQMMDGDGIVTVAQGATFDGGNTVGKLTAGTLIVGGNFVVGPSSYEAFSASGAHTTQLNGSIVQTVSFVYPLAQADRQHFHNLLITNTAGVNFLSGFAVNGATTVDAAAGNVTGATFPTLGGALSDPGSHWRIGYNLTLASVTITPADNLFKGSVYPVRIVARNTGSIQTPPMAARLQAFEAISGTPPQLMFVDYVIPSIMPGDSVVHNEVFAISPLVTVDSIRAKLTLDPGSALNEFDEADNTYTSGVIHLLPALPAGSSNITKTWVGVTSAWSNPANWSPAGVPTFTDSVLIAAGTPAQPQVLTPTSVGGLVVLSGAHLDLNATLASWGAIVAPGSITGAATLVLEGSGQIRGNLPGVVVNNTRSLGSTTTISGNVSIGNSGNLITSGPLTITGNLTLDSYGLITMNNPLGDVTVNGNVFLNRYDISTPTWSAGTLRVKGNFSTGGNSGEVLRASGSHKVILSGSAPQTLSIAYGGDGRHHFNDLEFANPDSVIVTGDIYVNNRASVTAGKVVGTQTARIVNGLTDAAGNRWRMATTRILGAAPELPAFVTTNIQLANATSLTSSVTVTGNVGLESGADFRLNGHTFRVVGNFTLDSYGLLRMDNGADVLDVSGNIFLNRYDVTSPVLSAGEIRVQGDFTTGGNSSEVFRPSGTHKVIFNGTGRQSIALAYGNDQRHWFNYVEFSNPDSVVVLTPIWIENSGTITAGRVVGLVTAHVRNGIFDAVGNRWQILNNRMFGPNVVIPTTIQGNLIFDTPVALGGNIHVAGAVTVNGGNLQLNGHTLRVDGNFLLDSYGLLTMTSAADVLDVGGDFFLNRYDISVPPLSAGEIRVQGNFATGGNSSEVLRATGTHKVIFNGIGRQTVSLAYGNDGRHHFNVVEFANPDSVHILTPIWINDSGTITAGLVVGQTTAHVRNGIFDALGNRWRITNNHMFGPSVVIPTTIQGNMYFDSPVALGSNVHVTGGVSINSGANLQLNGHTLQVDGSFTLDSYGMLTMNNAADVLDVRTDIYLNRYDISVPDLSAGEIRVRGNFATGGNSSEVFRPSGTHRVVFNGTGMQSISLAYGNDERHFFNHVEFANPDSVRFATPGWVNGQALITSGKVVGSSTLHVRQGVSDVVGNRWRVSQTHFLGLASALPTSITGGALFTSAVTVPQNLTVGGDIDIASGADLALNGHTITVGGNFNWDSYGTIRMDNAADVLDVAGFMFMNRYDGFTPVLTAGEIRLQGSFATGGNSSEVLRPSGTHKFIFDGSAPQSINLAYGFDGRHFFNDLEVRNPAGVTFTASAVVQRNASVAASPAGSRLQVAGGVTVDVVGALSLHTNSVTNILGTLKYGTFPLNLGSIIGSLPIPR